MSNLSPADAPDRLALHIAALVERFVSSLPSDRRTEAGVDAIRQLGLRLAALDPAAVVEDDLPIAPGRVLHALRPPLPSGKPRPISQPLIPLLDTTLVTGVRGEPNLVSQLQSEIDSSDRIDILVAFIRRSGLRPLLPALRRHIDRDRPIRVLTTTYTQSTERAALEQLTAAGADVRVSYDTSATRLHAKAWLFGRESGAATAYIGSSNMTHQAQVTGLKWNVRVSARRNPLVVEQVHALFESYWDSGDFVPFDPVEFDAQVASPPAGSGTTVVSPIDVRPYAFQARMLDQLQLSREQGFSRNLLVSATGTGKTVMSALDYAQLRAKLRRARLLFVAHREEILEQSLATFRQVLRDPAFGERWVGGHRPQHFDHVFASVQSLNPLALERIDPEHFDVVIVDEFHHAAAASYERLLARMRPVELLGMTATPERADGLPILQWFDDRIAAELRLWDAIAQQRLVPFEYYGLSDGTDLSGVTWRRGSGYDTSELTNVLTANDVVVGVVIDRVVEYVPEPSRMRALGFCVSVEHAKFMARRFTEAGIPSVAVWAGTPAEQRKAALSDLHACRVNAVFSVDLFNEGVDVPAVDVLLFLRPTESGTLFLQQLGRGLRRADGKAQCLVLDFVGHHRREFRFDRRYRALLGGSRQDLRRAVESGFPYLPAGCSLALDRVARDEVLRSLREAIPTRWPAKVDELRSLGDVTLAEFVTDTGLELSDVYAGRGWTDLREAAGLPVPPRGPHEVALRRAVGRLLHIDDRERLTTYRRLLAQSTAPDLAMLGERERRLLRMLVASVCDQALTSVEDLEAATQLLWKHPAVVAELSAVMDVLATGPDHLHVPWVWHPDVPLQTNARYTRIEILAALGEGLPSAKPFTWQTGVLKAERERADLLAFTLDKSSGGFSPTTRYRDYAMSPRMIHWESQSVTRAASETGRRYVEHAAINWSILLFCRKTNAAADRAFWFLGPASYVSHTGERPMAIQWRLETPLPEELYAELAAAVS